MKLEIETQNEKVSPKNISDLFRKLVDVSKQEHVLLFSLNTALKITRVDIVSIGTLDFCMIHPRDIFRIALESNAKSIIMAHNHPSDSIEPSEQDIAITKTIKEGGELLGINLIDHVIVTSDNNYSFNTRGLI